MAAALRQTIDHPDPTSQATGRALADRYTWQAAVTAHFALYETIAARLTRYRLAFEEDNAGRAGRAG